MKRAILYALVVVTIMTVSLVAYDMHQRQTLTPAPVGKDITTQPKTDKAEEPKEREETIATGFKKSVDKTKTAIKEAAGKVTSKAAITSSEKVTVVADIKGLRTTQGQIIAQLYDDINAFNNYRFDQAVATIMTPSKGFSGELRFEKLAKKKYALVLFHDANNNQKFDQKGAVMEGYAYSNNVGKTSLPNFHQAAFMADQNKTLVIHLIYH